MTNGATDSPHSPEPLTRDVICTRCGYNLRGLTVDKLCPECGTPIERSTHGNLLRYADHEWLDKLRLGTALMLWSLPAALVVGLATGILTAIGLPPIAVQLITVGAALFGFAAMFLLTAPEPTVAYTEYPITVRKLVRGGAVINLVGATLQQAAGVTPSALLFIASGVMLLIGTVAHFGLFVFLRRFAERIPDPKLTRQTRIVMWGYAVTYGLATLVGLVVFLAVGGISAAATATRAGGAPNVSTGIGIFVGGSACVLGMGSILFGIWYIVLLFRYHKAFKTAATQAGFPVDPGIAQRNSESESTPRA